MASHLHTNFVHFVLYVPFSGSTCLCNEALFVAHPTSAELLRYKG